MANIDWDIDWRTEGSRPSNQYNSAAVEAATQLQTARCLLVGLTATNSGAGAAYVQVHDSATTPSDGAVPVLSLPVAAGGHVSLDKPLLLVNGCYICNSSTAGTKTLGAAELLVLAHYRGS